MAMERRSARVSEAQWSALLEFLERNPNLARSRSYNNSARGRAESSRLWQEVANLLNTEGSGTTKTPKEWSIYVSNYKSKLKKIVADINVDVNATGGGPPQGGSLSENDQRFLAIMGPRFGQTAPQVQVNPFPDADLQEQSTSAMPQTQTHVASAENVHHEEIVEEIVPGNRSQSPTTAVEQQTVEASNASRAVPASLPRQTRQRRYRSRPLAPLDEANRILSQVELQRAAADAASAQALALIGQNLGRLADAAERYLSYIGGQ